MCLNDVDPYNMVFQDGHITGLIDVEMASPGPRIWDLARRVRP
ncbi:phosphotransferase [Cryobacterium sp. M91]